MQIVPDGWGRNTPVELLASARTDVDALFAWLDTDFGPRLQRLLSFLPFEVLALNPRLTDGSTLCMRLSFHTFIPL